MKHLIILLSLVTLIPMHLSAAPPNNNLSATLEDISEQLEALETKTDAIDEGYSREFAAGALAVGAGGSALVALQRGDMAALRNAIETISDEVSGQHSWFYPSWMPGLQGWVLLGLGGLLVGQEIRYHRTVLPLLSFFTSFIKDQQSENRQIDKLYKALVHVLNVEDPTYIKKVKERLDKMPSTATTLRTSKDELVSNE